MSVQRFMDFAGCRFGVLNAFRGEARMGRTYGTEDPAADSQVPGEMMEAGGDAFTKAAPPASGLEAQAASPTLGASTVLVSSPEVVAKKTKVDATLESARALVESMKTVRAKFTTSVGNETLEWSVGSYRVGSSLQLSGGSPMHALTLTVSRKTDFDNEYYNGERTPTRRYLDYDDIANDGDPAMRVLIPLIKKLLGDKKPGYRKSDGSTDSPYNSFIFSGDVTVPNRFSYNGKAKVSVSFTRDAGHPGMSAPETNHITLRILVNGMINDQPTWRKGEKYPLWNASQENYEEYAPQTDIFSEEAPLMSEEIGHEAMAKILARMRRLGILTW